MSRAQGSVIIDYYGGTDPERIQDAASRAEAVIVVAGLTYKDEGEFIPLFSQGGGDREFLGLDETQQRMISAAASANDRCIVVLEGGSAITMESWDDQAEAILMAWYPGMEGGNALADVLFGDVNPSGKLPLTFPRSDEQLYALGYDADSIVYGYDHDYRYFEREGLEPLFCFGHGLSYTSFDYGNLRVDEGSVTEEEVVSIHVDIANTGGRAGTEVVQLYIGYPDSRVYRPVKELKAFARVHLEPGENRTVTMNIDPQRLAFYDAASRAWDVESMQYEVHVGPSSQEIRLNGAFQIVD